MKGNLEQVRGLVSLRTTAKALLRSAGKVLLMAAIGAACTTPISAMGAQWNPGRLGPFCPPGSDLADEKHTEALSLKEQAQIKRTVLGFLALDATARRSGNPLGPSEYWEKGYTEEFDDTRDVPYDGLEYIAARFLNICTTTSYSLSIVLLDVAEFGPGELMPALKERFLSQQKYWDGINKTPVKPPNLKLAAIPKQPLIFAGIPMAKSSRYDDMWIVIQEKTPIFIKFQKKEWQRRINQTKLFSCNQPKNSPQYSADRCAQMELDQMKLKQFSRPAWSVFPPDFDSNSHVKNNY